VDVAVEGKVGELVFFRLIIEYMLSRTHEVVGVTALVIATVNYGPDNLAVATIIVALVANLVGTLLPDIDQASNRLWDMIPGGNEIGKLLKRVLMGHRTVSHSLIGIMVVYWGMGWLLNRLLNNNFVDINAVFMALMIGYISHLAADGLTEEGLPLLWPIKWKFGFPPIKSWRIKTGKWFENWVVFPTVTLFLIWYLWENWRGLL